MPPPSKALLKEELVRALAADLAVRERAYRAAYEAATHEEAKADNDKDTRALEQSYLARGEALRLEEQRVALSEVQAMPVQTLAGGVPVRLGALVTTEEDGQVTLFWIAPHGGGKRLAQGVLVLSPKSPLGRGLLGHHAGSECEVVVAGEARRVRIVSIG